jgi:hypothetical protein
MSDTSKELKPSIQAVLFDYGGVLAEEGFREGLKNIARWHGLDPEAFHRLEERWSTIPAMWSDGVMSRTSGI